MFFIKKLIYSRPVKEFIKKSAYYYQRIIKLLFKKIKNSGKTFLCYPDFPYFNTKFYQIALFSGHKMTTNPKKKFDFAILWQDLTFRTIDKTLKDINQHKKVFNIKCKDISKEKVDQLFSKIFGYSIMIDPVIFQGKAIRKNNINGAHDAIIIDCPIKEKEPGYVYQKLINSEIKPGLFIEYRLFIIDRKISFTTIRHRPPHGRFTGDDGTIYMTQTNKIFNQQEIDNINRFCHEFGLDYGELDTMRNLDDGKVYILDANTTPYGANIFRKHKDHYQKIFWLNLKKFNKYLDKN